MKKLKIVLLDLKSYYPSPPYQLGLLVAYACTDEAVKSNIEFSFSEHSREVPASEVSQAVLEADADLIAISHYAWNQKKLFDTLDLFTKAKGKLPYILIGGPNCSGHLGEEMLKKYSIISALVEGEGEPAFLDVCEALVNQPEKNPFLEARNCTLLDASGEVIRPNQGHRIGNLEEIPSPYLTGILPSTPSPIFYETNRGCPYRCSFCYWGNGNSKVYRMSVERVREEMEFFAKNRVRAFWLADANFGIFPTDAEIAQTMVDINEKHGYPFRSVGVNWAKNSSDRILEIAEIFRKGKMSTSTTIALQTVTAEAEKQSKRYSMSPAKFMNLLRAASQKGIDTYTDIILGLPGESLEEFINGLDTVTATGVPSVKIHQLVLIPGTAFYDNKEKFGLKTIPEVITKTIPAEEKSDYFDCTVVGHPKMSTVDIIRGRYFMGMIHLLHNHNLGQVVNLFLNRYDISNKQVYLFLEDLLLGRVAQFPEEKHRKLLSRLRTLFDLYANKLGVDDNQFIMKISFVLWFTEDETGLRVVNEPQVRAFMHDFYLAVCNHFNCCQTPEERGLLAALVDYNLLIAPKPAWRPLSAYTFSYQVHDIYEDMQRVVLEVTDLLESGKKSSAEKGNAWQNLPILIRQRVKKLLSESYLSTKRSNVKYQVKNPWGIPPSMKNIDWLVNSKSKHCIVSVENQTKHKDEIFA